MQMLIYGYFVVDVQWDQQCNRFPDCCPLLFMSLAFPSFFSYVCITNIIIIIIYKYSLTCQTIYHFYNLYHRILVNTKFADYVKITMRFAISTVSVLLAGYQGYQQLCIYIYIFINVIQQGKPNQQRTKSQNAPLLQQIKVEEIMQAEETGRGVIGSQRSLHPSRDSMISQRVSQTLLLNLLKQIAVLYLVMTLFSIPLFVLNGIKFSNIQEQHQQVVDIVALGLTKYISVHQNIQSLTPNNPQLESPPTNSYKYLEQCLYYDIFLQLLLVTGFMYIEYSSFKQKQHHKGYYIEDYSLQISNFHPMEPYIIVPKFQQFLISELKNRFELVAGQLELFDLVSLSAELKYYQAKLEIQKNMRLSQALKGEGLGNYFNNKILDNIQKGLSKVRTENVVSDTLWVTFETRQARYLALRYIQSSQCNFMNIKLKANKSPHPLQIEWQNFHIAWIYKFLSKQLSLIVCSSLLLAFDLLILIIHNSQYPILASFVILLLQIILKSIIILISGLEKHHHKSHLHSSIFSKLTKFLYANTALIIFISCFDFGQFAAAFSTREFDLIRGSEEWYLRIGIYILISFFVQIFYVNVRPAIQIGKAWLFKLLREKWKQLTNIGNNSNNQDDQDENKTKIKMKSELDICYAHIISLLMFGNTYTLTHPIFYPFLSLFCIAAYYSHKKYIAQYTQPAPYNSDYLNNTSIQYLYASVIAHSVIVFVGFQFIPALVLAAVGFVILIFKNTLIAALLRLARKKIGPFCFSKFQRLHSSTTTLTSILTIDQLNTHILNLEQKIRMYTLLYNTKFEKQDFINKGCLQRSIKLLQQKIDRLCKIRQQRRKENRMEGINNQNIGKNIVDKKQQEDLYKMGRRTMKMRQIKGVISYKLTDEMLKL